MREHKNHCKFYSSKQYLTTMKAKKTFLYMLMLSSIGLTTSCLSEVKDLEPNDGNNTTEQKGQLVLNLSASTDFAPQTRALNEANYRNTDNYTVQLINAASGNVMFECLGSEVASNLPKTLEIGSYEVKAFYGTESAASRSDFRVEGSTTFQIQANDTKTVNVSCLPTCGRVKVNFDDEMATYYSDYNVSFGGTSALGTNTFAWAKADTDPWYVAVNNTGETINYTISVTAKEEYAHVDGNGVKQTAGTATGSFQLKRNAGYKLNVKPQYTPTTEGGIKVVITIDESTNDRPVTIEVPLTWI